MAHRGLAELSQTELLNSSALHQLRLYRLFRASFAELPITLPMEPAFYLWSNTRDDGQWVSSSSNSLARFQLSDFRDRKRPLILSFVLQQRAFDARVEPGIAGYLPRFPVRLLRELYQTATWGRGTVVLPNLTDDNGQNNPPPPPP